MHTPIQSPLIDFITRVGKPEEQVVNLTQTPKVGVNVFAKWC